MVHFFALAAAVLLFSQTTNADGSKAACSNEAGTFVYDKAVKVGTLFVELNSETGGVLRIQKASEKNIPTMITRITCR